MRTVRLHTHEARPQAASPVARCAPKASARGDGAADTGALLQRALLESALLQRALLESALLQRALLQRALLGGGVFANSRSIVLFGNANNDNDDEYTQHFCQPFGIT